MPDLPSFPSLVGREAWVAEFLDYLPNDSILKWYVKLATCITDANAAHHIPMGLILLSQTGPKRGIELNDRATRNNIYCLVTGSSGARKTAALKIGLNVAADAGLTSVLADVPGSREGFIDSMDEFAASRGESSPETFPRQALVYEEFSDFLGITATGTRGRGAAPGHAHTLRGSIMQAYDGGSGTRKLAARRDTDGNMTEQTRGTKYPRVSLIGASNYRVLTKYTTVEDWTDGFMGRFYFTDGELERWNLRQGAYPEMLLNVAGELRLRAEQEQIRGREGDPFGVHFFPKPPQDSELTPEAERIFAQWAYDVHKRSQDAGLLLGTAMTRTSNLALRIALLLSWDYGEAREVCYGRRKTWRITEREMFPAILLAERHLQSYEYAVGNIVLNPEEEPIRDVEQEIRKADNGRKALTIGEISRSASRTIETVDKALRTLQVRRTVGKRQRIDSTDQEFFIYGGQVEKVLLFPTRPPDPSNLFG